VTRVTSVATAPRSHRDLLVWQQAMTLVETIYRVTSSFPSDERFGLTSQMRRSAVSVAANIAEGAGRNGRKEYAQFVGIALGSAVELETLVELAARLNLIADTSKLIAEVGSVRMLATKLRNALSSPPVT
jgi:four helix bundle protein